ncbi:MAG: Eco57I restriction-modification methylase domain-containing protein, partial [Armatimonadetes bacterium]|nr:Eco57I restriction-modification methylase domain-containing protein [Armatimonadota bacterium]
IVSFMCREALKGYLGGYAELVDEHKADAISVPVARQLLQRLQDVKVVDPACGSGAYLLGMLHELHTITRLLDTRAEETPKTDYRLKLSIIQNNLYGVDLDEFAVNIARLRLWLALAVEFEGEKPEPLPNLDFKIEVGDSLSAPEPNFGAKTDMFRQAQIEEYHSKKREYGSPYSQENKEALKEKIRVLRREIAESTHKDEKIQGFDWSVEFAEVLASVVRAEHDGAKSKDVVSSGGFDIVLANPPYVRHELIKEQKSTLTKVYPQVYAGAADLYCYFYARAIQLLKPDGMLAFISPNKWFRAGYGANLRKHIGETCRVHSITDFGDLPVFQAATAYPMIFIAQKGTGDSKRCLTEVKSLEDPYLDILALVRQDGKPLSESALKGSNWMLASSTITDLLHKMNSGGLALRQYHRGQIYSGIKTGFNPAFVISGAKRTQLIAQDPTAVEIIKPLAVGKDVKRWCLENRDTWLIVTKIGVEIERYPAVFAHLQQWQSELEKRADQGNHWWELRACAYYDAFDKPKIIYPQIMNEPQFAYDETATYTNQKCFTINSADKFLLGVLNSSTIWQFIKEGSPPLRGGYSEPRKDFIASLIIPNASDADKFVIAALVEKCLDAKGAGCEAWEAEIDARVAALYGL